MPEYLKKSNTAAYNYVLKDVNKFIEKIKSKEQKTNLSLFEEFFEYSPADYAKNLINTKNRDKDKKNCRRGRMQNIKFKRQNKKNE